MDHSKAVVAASSPVGNSLPLAEAESMLSALVYDVSQHVHLAMENMLKMTSEIDQSSSEIMEELEKCKESATMRKKNLEEEKECTQKAAYAVLEMLSAQGSH